MILFLYLFMKNHATSSLIDEAYYFFSKLHFNVLILRVFPGNCIGSVSVLS